MAKNSGIDLSKLSIEELENLAKDVQTELSSRKEAERERVLAQMRELAGSLGLTLEDVVRMERGGKGAPSSVKPKYRNPENSEQTWTGRGKRPAWVNEALEKGKQLEDLAI